jgi:hypothetical protein
MLTDPTKMTGFKACYFDEDGFTQAWDTVGAGENIPRRRELNLEERTAPQ